jgi:hypothetical protein
MNPSATWNAYNRTSLHVERESHRIATLSEQILAAGDALLAALQTERQLERACRNGLDRKATGLWRAQRKEVLRLGSAYAAVITEWREAVCEDCLR